MHKLLSRRLMIVVLVVVAMAICASPAAADKPPKYDFLWTSSGTITGICPFDVAIEGRADVTAIDLYDASGVLVRSIWHAVEQDTFSANGKTLVSVPYAFNGEWTFDSDGNWTHLFTTGVSLKVPLPDGTMFVSAGRSDWADHPGASFIISPDHGNPGNVEALCAALAP